MRTIILTGAVMLAGGCAGQMGEPGAALPAQGLCDAQAAQPFLGETADEAIAAQILAQSGAHTLRWGPPGAAWTMDYRQTRVSVRYDDAMTITEISCG